VNCFDGSSLQHYSHWQKKDVGGGIFLQIMRYTFK
jgi:hypothetical protein